MNTPNNPDYYEWDKKKKQLARDELRERLIRGEEIGKIGKKLVSIPITEYDIPTYRHDPEQQSGVGHGKGEIGTPLAPGEPRSAGGQGAGDMPGQHILEVEVEIEEAIAVLRQELELPPMSPTKKAILTQKKERYNTIALIGPEGLRHFKKTFFQALKRQLISGDYNIEKPIVIPIQKDKRYKSWKWVLDKDMAGVLIFMMDISGSMWDEQKAIARQLCFWIQTWALSEHPHLDVRYIVHDALAWQVDAETFFNIRQSGGTQISSAYKEVSALIDPKRGSVMGDKRIIRSPDEWNIYVYHFSDGDNWSADDSNRCLRILNEQLLPHVSFRQFGYFQIKSPYGSGNMKGIIDKYFFSNKYKPKVKTTELERREEILRALKDVLGVSRKGGGGND